MIEVTGEDIARLNDTDLRTLVFRLATTELRARGCPISGITAGGNQDAADGGVDVRVRTKIALTEPDFVPRASTGFQVKKSDMPPGAIAKEMAPKGELRPTIRDIADEGGAYIIVSAQGTVTETGLAARRQAMREQCAGVRDEKQLLVDFYDRDRVAAWVNLYPGVMAWTRQRIGRPISGWRNVSQWLETSVGEHSKYLMSDKRCLVDERTKEREKVTVAEGIERVRKILNEPGQCVRLIGMSGTGKTRFVQALFESGLGVDPLDPSITIYTEYSEEPSPTAMELCRNLVESKMRTILVVDNCNPDTHDALVQTCSEKGSRVSLLSVEYDIREKESDRTEVFRLEPSSPDLVSDWLKIEFSHISQIDRTRIGEFSDGNFRIAKALAHTLKRGETLGQLKHHQLFDRIFHQRKSMKSNLIQAAETLSLFYSFNGENTEPESELDVISKSCHLSSNTLYRSIADMLDRGVAQSRGKWRAILPQAIANTLAARALSRMPPNSLDQLVLQLPQRLIRSFTRRLSYLHDVPEARICVLRWLDPTGPFGNLLLAETPVLDILALAPVAPEALSARIADIMDSAEASKIFSHTHTRRSDLLRTIKALSYEPDLFRRQIQSLHRFLPHDLTDNNNDNTLRNFSELFHIYLSGTKAPPILRQQVIRELALSDNPATKRSAGFALEALLRTSHFSSSSNFDFGSRPRDYGWIPETNSEVWEWYSGAVELAFELRHQLPSALPALASHVRGLWKYFGCHDTLLRVARAVINEGPWIDGWLAFRATYGFDHKEMPDESRKLLVEIIKILKPANLLDHARSVILRHTNVSWDPYADGYNNSTDVRQSRRDASKLAQEIGCEMATNHELLTTFLPEVFGDYNSTRAYEFGAGIAQGSDNLEKTWRCLVEHLIIYQGQPFNRQIIRGFLNQTDVINPQLCENILDSAIDDDFLLCFAAEFQAAIGVDKKGANRLRLAIQKNLPASAFMQIACRVVESTPVEDLISLIEDISNLSNGLNVALEILHMRFLCDEKHSDAVDIHLASCGRRLLCKINFYGPSGFHDHSVGKLIRTCVCGAQGTGTAAAICGSLSSSTEDTWISPHNIQYTLQSLFNCHPLIALDLLLGKPNLLEEKHFQNDSRSLIDEIEPSLLAEWAERDPIIRYATVARCLSMFKSEEGKEAGLLAPLFFEFFDKSSNKIAALGEFWGRFIPNGSGFSTNTMALRRKALDEFDHHPEEAVRSWASSMRDQLDWWIKYEHDRDQEAEQSFE